VVGPGDPEYERKIQWIQRLSRRLPANETIVFQDELDVHLNPKIGSCWMPRGEQAEVRTPGNNEKKHIAGSIHWRTGPLLLSAAGPKRIHVIYDSARFHNCQAVLACLEQHAGRPILHYLRDGSY
jgi:putative transposase